MFEDTYAMWTERRLTQALDVCERTFRRWVERYREEESEGGGVEALRDRRVSRASHRAAPVDEVMRMVDEYRTRYCGWNVRHYHTRYRRGGGERSYNWVRTKLQAAGAVPRGRGRGKHRKRREPAPCAGMMLHQDGSTHAWAPGVKWDLIVTMDDATNEHYSMFFCEEEGVWSSFRGMREVIEAKVMDDSVKRYVFRGVIENKRRYQELQGPISWLEQAKLASKCYPVDCRPVAPLEALTKDNIFKLFLFDVGLLGHMLDMEYSDQRVQAASYKGFIAENFVQNELRSRVRYPTYSWAESRSEIELPHRCRDGEIIPVEVKSVSRTKARSLRAYVERYEPGHTVILSGKAGKWPDEGPSLIWPLYYAQYLGELQSLVY